MLSQEDSAALQLAYTPVSSWVQVIDRRAWTFLAKTLTSDVVPASHLCRLL